MQLAKKHIKNSAAPVLSGKDKLKMQCEKKNAMRYCFIPINDQHLKH